MNNNLLFPEEMIDLLVDPVLLLDVHLQVAHLQKSIYSDFRFKFLKYSVYKCISFFDRPATRIDQHSC